MGGTSVEPLAQSVDGSTTNQMEGIEVEEQSAPKPAPPNQNPSEDATDKDGYGCSRDPGFYCRI